MVTIGTPGPSKLPVYETHRAAHCPLGPGRGGLVCFGEPSMFDNSEAKVPFTT
jgi:hypothetical protein